jgi:hypothetical protein
MKKYLKNEWLSLFLIIINLLIAVGYFTGKVNPTHFSTGLIWLAFGVIAFMDSLGRHYDRKLFEMIDKSDAIRDTLDALTNLERDMYKSYIKTLKAKIEKLEAK